MKTVSEKDAILAWHFVGDMLRDGRPVPEDGVTLVHDGPLVMCESGLHASRHPFDALAYAPGNILCRVRCWGDVIEEDDKIVCTNRQIIARRDATDGLRYFARMQALSVAQLWEIPDVVLEFLMTGDGVAAARDAAWAAVRDAARDAAWDAAMAAAMAAARAAAWAAARAAARDAAMAAARDAARDAAWAELVNEAFEGVP